MALRIEHDLWYIQDGSLWLDLKILLTMPGTITLRAGASECLLKNPGCSLRELRDDGESENGSAGIGRLRSVRQFPTASRDNIHYRPKGRWRYTEQGQTREVVNVARAIADIRKDIESLNDEERADLIRTLIAELDAPADQNAERAWLAAANRRYSELIQGKVQGVPGHLVFERLHSRLGQ